MDRREPGLYPQGMRIAAFLLVWLGVASPAFAQTCDVSTKGGDIFQAQVERGKPALGWDVKRLDHLGSESEFFSRPALSLIFTVGSDGKLTGPVGASVAVTSNSDRELGAAPRIDTMRLRARLDDAVAITWGADSADGEVRLARALREGWPRELEIDIVAPDGDVVATGVFDAPARFAMEAAAAKRDAACFH